MMSDASPFKWRHFEAEIILLCVRWYLRYALSYRDLEEMMLERGLQSITARSIAGCNVTLRSWKNDAVPTSRHQQTPGGWMRRTSKSKKCGCTSTEPSTPQGTRSSFS